MSYSLVIFIPLLCMNIVNLWRIARMLFAIISRTGGLLCSIFGQNSTKSDVKFNGLSRSTVVVISFVINTITYVLIFINLPNDSPFGDTHAKSFIKPKYENIVTIIYGKLIIFLILNCYFQSTFVRFMWFPLRFGW